MTNRLADLVEKKTRALIEKSERHFMQEMPTVEIRFDLRGQAAGKVTFQKKYCAAHPLQYEVAS